jgi:methylmalonyl-CoA/ethylmalonyl-CoA epimerase
MKIQHIGIGVRDLDATVRFYEKILGIPVEDKLEWGELGLRAAVIPVAATRLEFIEPTNPQGDVAQSLARLVAERDGAVHHLAFEVDDLDQTIQQLTRQGIKLMTDTPLESPGGRLLWLSDEETSGTMIELVEQGYRIC